MPAIVLVVGLALTASAAWFADQYLARAELAQAAQRTESATSAVRLALDRIATAVRAVRAMYAADIVTSDQFVRFARTLTRTQTIRSLGFYRRVESGSRAAYEQRFRTQPAATLGIWQYGPSRKPIRAAERPVYYVVESGFVADGSEPTYGLDIAADPALAKSIEDALERFELIATDVVTFPVSGERGILLDDPVLDRNGAAVGVATASLTLEQLSRTASLVSGVSGISISVGDPVPPSQLKKEDELASPDPDSRAFNLGGRSWTVTVASVATEPSFRHWVLALIVGLGLSTTVAALAFIVSMYKTAEVTSARIRLSAMLDGLGPLAWLLAPDGTILNANRAAAAAFDRPESDMVGQPFWAVLDGEGSEADRGASAPRSATRRRARTCVSISPSAARRSGASSTCGYAPRR